MVSFRRLSGLDGLFLNLEMPGQPMQVIALGLLRSPTGAALTLGGLARHLTERLDQLPALRWRLVSVPGGLGHPGWAEDPHFDLGAHLHHMVLPEPSGPAELDAACGRLAARQLDRDRPLWRITLIDGLADGRQGLVLEVHHALMDGAAVGATLARIFSAERPVAAPAETRPGRTPGLPRLITSALIHDARTWMRLPGLISRTRRARAAVRQRQARADVRIPGPGAGAPESAINQGFTAHRHFGRVALPLEDVLVVKALAGATVNDVALAVVGGALRGYLLAREALPERSLVACVPVGLDEAAACPRAVGNCVSHLDTSLGTDIADPWERLQRISAVTREAKACHDLTGGTLRAEWLECVPPAVTRLLARCGQALQRRGAGRATLDSNVVVSNLRGPAAAWWLGSTLVEEVYMAPPGGGAGVNLLLWDYAGCLMFGILSYTDSVPNPAELAELLSSSLGELVTAAGSRRLPAT